MTTNNSVVAIHSSHAEAETAVKEFEKPGYDLSKLPIFGHEIRKKEHIVSYYNAGGRMKSLGGLGAFWGWISDGFFGSAFFLIPGIGPLMVAASLVGWMVGGMEGAAMIGGLSAIGAGFLSLGNDVAEGKWMLQEIRQESVDMHRQSIGHRRGERATRWTGRD